jgi:hypothetical protein
LDLPVLGGMQLLVNAGHPTVAAAITTGAEMEGARYIRDAMKFDVARALVAGALTNHEFDLESDYEEESIGAALQRLVRVAFPRRQIDELRIRHARSPSDLEADLQAFLGLFHSTPSGT